MRKNKKMFDEMHMGRVRVTVYSRNYDALILFYIRAYLVHSICMFRYRVSLVYKKTPKVKETT